MSEDDAFVRAIVDAPGDDAPRLVYADWLDERGDLRGQYLRNEMKFRNVAPIDRRRYHAGVRASGQLLDPHWIARVSRPPLGVCCDRMQLLEHDLELARPALTVAAIDAVEARYGVTLPVDYRAFLLNYNGGLPKPATLATPAGVRYALYHFHTIWSMDGTAPYDDNDFVARLQLQIDDVLWHESPFRDMVDIARVEIGRHEWLCLGWRGEPAGKVYLIDLWMEDPEPVIQLADSLPELFGLFVEQDGPV